MKTNKTLDLLAAEGNGYSSASGEVANFRGDGTPLSKLAVNIRPAQARGIPAPNGPNVYDASTNTEGYYIGDDGNLVVGANSFYSGYYTVNANQRYQLSATITFTSLSRVRIHGYDASKNWVLELYLGDVAAGTQSFQAVVTIPAGVSFVRFSFNKNNTNTIFHAFNELPISGDTLARIRRTGKNLFDADGLLNASGWVKNDDGSYSGMNYALTSVRFDVDSNCLHSLLSYPRYGIDYTFSANVSQNSTLYVWFVIIDADTGTARQVGTPRITGTSFVLTANCASNEYVESLNFSYGQSSIITLSNVQLELGRAATAYSAYVGKTYPVSWETEAGIVCGGTLEWLGGDQWKLTVTYANISSYNGESIAEPWLSSMDVYAPGATPTTGAQVVYPLTTPVEYTFTATDSEVDTLLGPNNIVADCGAVSVEFHSLANAQRSKLALLLRDRRETELLALMREGAGT